MRRDYNVKISHLHKTAAREDLFPSGDALYSFIWNVDVSLRILKCIKAVRSLGILMSQAYTK